MSMKLQTTVRILILAVLLVSFISINQPAHASTNSIDKPDMRISGRNFPQLQQIIPDQPTVSTVVSPSSLNIGESAVVTVSLNNVPVEGYTSVELTCSYDPNLVEAGNIVVASLFGIDPVTAVNGPQEGRFIVAIVGTSGNKATNSGTVIVFVVRGRQAGQAVLECKARVPKGDNVLTEIQSAAANLTILGSLPTPTFQPPLCDKAQFVADINIPDGTVFSPGAAFIKTWRLKNIGSCVWTTSYKIVFFSGEQMRAPSPSQLPVNVLPGQTVDISVSMTAPSVAGSYRSNWMFQNANGALFGIGTQANKPWWMDIRVSGPSATPGNPVNSPTPTINPTLCDKAEFIANVNVPPGTVMAPGETFLKTWRLSNVGSCTWNMSYQLVFFSGERMGAVASASFPRSVAPGQTVDLSLDMTAPAAPGPYRGYWMFKNANGVLFGVGPQANQPWFVDIVVSGATPTPTIQPTACDKAEFITDVNVPPGTVFSPGAPFRKTWRLKNVGTCTWTPSYRIAFLSGEQMGAVSSFQLPANVAPGVTVDLSLDMTAPSVTGSYRGYWIFQNATGGLCGIGPLGNEPWFVDILVSNTTLTPGPMYTGSPMPSHTPVPSVTPGGPTVTPFGGVVYDFVEGMCTALWTSGAGQLLCPGIDGNAKGFVFRVDNPRLETGTTDSRPSLLTFPQNVQDGYIQGLYPPIHIQNGDRFRSTVTCEFGATDCYVNFRLDYQVGSAVQTFWGPFRERYEGQHYSLDIDLSPLAGQDVKFILTVLSTGSPIGDRALWVGPIIYRSNLTATQPVASATLTPVESFTATALPEVGLLTGQVHAGKPVTISVYRDNAILVTSAPANIDGTFSFTLPVGPYLVFANANGFLGAEGSVAISAGSTGTMPVIRLSAGDIDGNNRIDQFDVLTIGMNYNTATPAAADLNNDGVINVLDLELLARDYRKAGPIPWNDYE